MLLRRALELRGYYVMEFGSTEEALGWETLSEGTGIPPLAQADLLLLDVNLPGISGIETIEIMKESPRLRNIPIAMLTAQRSSETVLKCIQLGASDYFSKPLEFQQVMNRIDKLLSDPSGILTRTGQVMMQWGFQDFLIRELKRSERSDDHLSILVGGIREVTDSPEELSADHIDRIWSQPPPSGEAVQETLNTFIQACRRTLREYDVIEPFGDGDFSAILPDTPQWGRIAVSKKLYSSFRDAIGTLPESYRTRWALFLGGATFPEDGRDRLTLFSNCESRLQTGPPTAAKKEPESDLLYSKTVRCAGCGDHIIYSKVLTRKIKPRGRESDLRLLFDEIDPLYYRAISCTGCGLSALESDLEGLKFLERPAFGWLFEPRERGAVFTVPTKTLVPDDLTDHISPPYQAWVGEAGAGITLKGISEQIQGRDQLIPEAKQVEKTLLDREVAIARHRLVRETYRFAGASPLRRARVAHRLGWLYRAGNDTENEQIWLSEALDFYLTAFHFEDLLHSRPSEMEILFLLGELAFRLGREAAAVAVFERMVRDPRLESKESFRRMIHRRWYEARHETPPDEDA